MKPVTTSSVRKPSILVIDNYDSFVFNVVRYFEELGETVRVARNDALDVAGIRALAQEAIVISPGPCTPAEAGISLPAIRELSGAVPLLGVCLGHQAIGEAMGGRVVRAAEIVHGKMGTIHHVGAGVFAGLPTPFQATRYHSLIVERATQTMRIDRAAFRSSGISTARTRWLGPVANTPDGVVQQVSVSDLVDDVARLYLFDGLPGHGGESA